METPDSLANEELGSDAAREAVAAIVQKADKRQQERAEAETEQVAAGPRRPFLARPAVAVSLFVVFAAVLSVDVYLLTRPAEPPSPAELESAARMETAVVALQIEAYKQSHGRYPTSLGEAGVELTGVDYVRTNDGFVLEAKGDQSRVTLRADQDPEQLVRGIPPIPGGVQ